MKQLQIGVMGSAADLTYSEDAEQIAEKIGKLIAEKNAILVFGAEKDSDSLSTCACRGAQKAGGITVGVTYGKGKDLWDDDKAPTVIIPCGLERGGGREFSLVLSCDAVIAISGGSGTLTETAIAYQANIPVICLTGFGGWADKLADTYLDDRKRILFRKATTPEEAVEMAIKAARGTRKQWRNKR